jgi:hypothetical protein
MFVSIFHPSFWLSHGHWDYQHHTPESSGIWKDISYKINSIKSTEADFIVVHEDIDHQMKLKAKAGGFILVTGEEKAVTQYHQEYLNQFDLIVTSRDDLRHHRIIHSHYLHPWRIKKNYDELLTMSYFDKPKILSAIISNLTILPNHKKRFSFINKLKGHYKNKLDWFAKGEDTFLEDKWNGLAPYKYSIAIENSSYNNYFTEKISDCFLAFAMPFYSGCPNIKDFFDERSFVEIDIENFIKSIDIIDNSIENDLDKSNLKFIEDSRRLVLDRYHFIAELTNILSKIDRSEVKVTKIIHPQGYYKNGTLKRLAKSSFDQIFRRL